MKGDRISKTGELETPNLVVYRRRVKTYQISWGRVAIKYEIETRGEPIRLMDGLEHLYQAVCVATRPIQELGSKYLVV